MTDNVFLDTNLWIYLYSKDPAEKYQEIEELVKTSSSSIKVSTQILGETFHVLTRKKLASKEEAVKLITRIVSNFTVYSIDTAKVLQALEINARYSYSYWDSLIISTALNIGCSIIYSEDMQHNQLIENKVRILNPFL